MDQMLRWQKELSYLEQKHNRLHATCADTCSTQASAAPNSGPASLELNTSEEKRRRLERTVYKPKVALCRAFLGEKLISGLSAVPLGPAGTPVLGRAPRKAGVAFQRASLLPNLVLGGNI